MKVNLFAEDLEEIFNLYNTGYSTYEVANILNISPMVVFNRLKWHNIKLRNHKDAMRIGNTKKKVRFWKNKKIVLENKLIKKKYLEGVPIGEISKLVEIKDRAINSRLKEIGVNLNRMKSRGEKKKIRCQCGCNEKLWNLDSQRRFRNYIKGHNGKKYYNLLPHKKKIKLLYLNGESTKQIGKKFNVGAGVINNFLKRNNITIFNRQTFGRISISEDGHKVKSGMELEVDNWLFRNRIPHIYEKRLGETLMRCDFFLPEQNMYIEVAGLNTKKYISNFNKKMKLYKSLGIGNNLLIILPKDNIQKKLKEHILDDKSLIYYEIKNK